MITVSETKQIRSSWPGAQYPYTAPSASHVEMGPSWFERRGAGLSVTNAYIKAQPVLDKVASTADMFGEGRAFGTQLGILDFVGECGEYSGESPDEFEFNAYGILRTIGGAAREVRLRGIAQADERTPVMFRGNAILEESYSWADMPSVYQVRGVIERAAKSRARHSPPSRAYNAFTELAGWLELSNDELAKILEISRTTVSMSWKKGVEPHNKAKARRIYELHSVVAALHNTLGPELSGWLKQGRPCPLKLLEQRKYERFERRADEVIFGTGRKPRIRLDTAPEPQPSARSASEGTLQLKPAGRARSKRLAR